VLAVEFKKRLCRRHGGEGGSMNDLATQELNQLERLIEKNLTAFYEVGRALIRIRDGELYKDEYRTFEEYCKQRWDFARRTAYQFIDSVKVIENVRHGAQNISLPVNERQARSLTRLSPDQQKKAWQRAVETAPEGKVTAAHVQRVVQEMKKPEIKHITIHGVKSTAMRYAVRAISELSNIAINDPAKSDALNRVRDFINGIYDAKEPVKPATSVQQNALDNLKRWWAHAKTDQRKAFSNWAHSSEGVMSWTHSRPKQAEQIIDEAIIVIEAIPHTDPKRRDALQKLRNWIDKHWR
jgi:hypothetical protein